MGSVSLWRKTKIERAKFKDGGIVPTALSPYSQKLVPDFEGVGDTMGFDGPVQAGVYNRGETLMLGECAWCGSTGAHKPDCKALSRNYPRTSLSVQREMTQQLRAEMDKVEARAYTEGRIVQPSSFGGVYRTKEPPKDERTDLQKRFDAIAEELEENK